MHYRLEGSRTERRLWRGNAGAPHGRGRERHCPQHSGNDGVCESEDGGVLTPWALAADLPPVGPRLQPAAHAHGGWTAQAKSRAGPEFWCLTLGLRSKSLSYRVTLTCSLTEFLSGKALNLWPDSGLVEAEAEVTAGAFFSENVTSTCWLAASAGWSLARVGGGHAVASSALPRPMWVLASTEAPLGLLSPGLGPAERPLSAHCVLWVSPKLDGPMMKPSSRLRSASKKCPPYLVIQRGPTDHSRG